MVKQVRALKKMNQSKCLFGFVIKILAFVYYTTSSIYILIIHLLGFNNFVFVFLLMYVVPKIFPNFRFVTTSNVEIALSNYFRTLNINDELSDMDYVCNKCVKKPYLASLEQLTEHLQMEHCDIDNAVQLKNFILENITFEEILQLESATDCQSDDSDNTKKKIKLATLFCPFCESIFSSPTRLICHLNKHMEINMDEVNCCDIMFREKKLFVQHLQDDHVTIINADNLCRTCGMMAKNAAELKAHIIETHNDKVTAKETKLENLVNQKYIPAVCPICNKTYSNKYNMFVHMNSHEDQIFKCDKCDKVYRFASNLMNHKKLAHEGVMDYVCSSCGEAFPSRSARDVHARLHSGIRPYRCQYCCKSYRAKNTLDRHIEMHLDIRKYECEICAKKFRKKSHLNYHIKTHAK